ncbi:MAG TPA: SIMPL domain-containing protein [Gemmatimonadaceae bacterium]
MRYTMALALTAVLSACSLSAQANPATGTRDLVPIISATGEGRREVAPDKATIVLGVETRAKTPAAAASANAERMTAIRAALIRAGVAERDIATARYSLGLEFTGRTQMDTQYVAANLVTVTTRQLDQVGRIIDTGLGAGANNINSLHYDLTDRSPVQAQALGDAVQNARRQAEVMAEAAGGRLGELVELTTSPGEYRPFFAGDMAMRVQASAAPTPVSPGAVTVVASVSGRWRFIPGR